MADGIHGSCCYCWETYISVELEKGSVPGLLFLLLIPAYKIIQSGDRNFDLLDGTIRNGLSRNEQPIRVFTDGLISYGYPYFYDFKDTDDQYIWFSEIEGVEPKEGDFLLVNPPYLNERYNDLENLELLKKQVNKRGLKLDNISRGAIELYRIVK